MFEKFRTYNFFELDIWLDKSVCLQAVLLHIVRYVDGYPAAIWMSNILSSVSILQGPFTYYNTHPEAP